MTVAFRVQSTDGRGPWRPGFSHTWIEAEAPADRLVETIFDLMDVDRILAASREMHLGSACRSLVALMQWFTPIERANLARLGFYPVRLIADHVLAESATQMVIGRRRPFDDGATRLRWPA